ncbi:hypothetical protein N825_00130 [Skermanella stibiiresistens SB22]|uniref:Uncharacterized protein n=1 Tax=Skermanella stibiiresistens SB22 TaxID=1385369 RepID=W9H932_9PROT|nr:hypothetical protein [Skermanella stibiiresistens]EWY42775.1 hypothetical protein N825_00130 [Skermanella stibiiresistens SB22]
MLSYHDLEAFMGIDDALGEDTPPSAGEKAKPKAGHATDAADDDHAIPVRE